MIFTQAISRIVSCSRIYRHSQAFLRITACAVLALALSPPLPALAANTIVRMEIAYGSNLGTVDIELYDDQAPKTVTNFLRYAARGDYNYNIIHRSVPGFVIQGGGFKLYELPYHMMVEPPVQNEFSPSRSNVRGTIAMAKLNGNPDSATSEWFFNLADNSGYPYYLDVNNGGYTVFGRVIAGMNVVDDIAGLQILDHSSAGAAFGELPVINYDPTKGLTPDNLVGVNRIPNVASAQTPSGAMAIFTAGVNMTFNSVKTVDANTSAIRLTEFKSPPNESLYFNNGMFTLKLAGTMNSADDLVVTLYDGAANRPTRYYAYGKTPDNQTDHWYDFSYDSATGTGAEIVGDRILLHFVDGQRGDEDLTVNNSITHTGAQAVVTSTTSTNSQSGGCSISSTPSQAGRRGDWIVVFLFLVYVAFIRKHTRRRHS